MSTTAQPEWLGEAVRLYQTEGLTMKQVQARLDVTTVEYWFRKTGVSRRSSGTRPQPLSAQARRAVDLYQQGKKTQEIADELGCATTAIYNWLDKAGVPRRRTRRRAQTPAWVAQAALMQSDGATHAQIADRVGVCPATVSSWLRKTGVSSRPAGRRRVEASVVERARAMYLERRMTMAQIAEQLDVSISSVRNYLDAAGVDRRAGGGARDPEKVDRAVSMYTGGGATLSEIGAALGASQATVASWLRSRGVERRRGRRPAPQTVMAQAIALDEQGLTRQQIAEQLGVAPGTVRRWMRQAGRPARKPGRRPKAAVV